jgi:hypothetical protein
MHGPCGQVLLIDNDETTPSGEHEIHVVDELRCRPNIIARVNAQSFPDLMGGQWSLRRDDDFEHTFSVHHSSPMLLLE